MSTFRFENAPVYRHIGRGKKRDWFRTDRYIETDFWRKFLSLIRGATKIEVRFHYHSELRNWHAARPMPEIVATGFMEFDK